MSIKFFPIFSQISTGRLSSAKAFKEVKIDATYVHDQDAYVVDQNALGSFSDIGYDAPNSPYFVYSNPNNNSWQASKGAKGPDCDNPWKVVHTVPANNKTTHTATPGCANLTPNFSTIGSGSAAGS